MSRRTETAPWLVAGGVPGAGWSFNPEPVAAPDDDRLAQEVPEVPAGLVGKVLSRARDYIRKRWDGFDWSKSWHCLPAEYFAGVALHDKVRLRFGSAVMSELGDELDRLPELELFLKVESSLWQHGCLRHWNRTVEYYRALLGFDFGPGFEVRLDYTTYTNPYGYSKHARVYLDGAVGLLVYQAGQHVLTLGVSPASCGLLVQQVQLARPRGNRWLYRLPGGLLDHALARLTACVPGRDVYLVDGDSLAQRIRRHYPRAQREQKMPESECHRLASHYGQPLASFERDRAGVCTYHGLSLFPLRPVSHSRPMAVGKIMQPA